MLLHLYYNSKNTTRLFISTEFMSYQRFVAWAIRFRIGQSQDCDQSNDHDHQGFHFHNSQLAKTEATNWFKSKNTNMLC